MTFDDLLDQAIALLQRRRRVTYRTLKRQFQLDEHALEDLKEELIYGQRLAVDEDSRVLVWTGGMNPSAAVASAASHQEGQQTTIRTQPAPPAELHPPDAERRQLTVMFCDLVDSTALSSQLDPEDHREVVRAYQETGAGIIHRFDGYIAQCLGDALLVYFGWPQAHEDDAQRGVRTGLGMLAAMAELNARLEQEKGVRLEVRIGLHTGLVVVGEMGGRDRLEHLAMGETPNVAARIQGLATPNTT
jgi:class 3 adenylate cyclase